MKRKKNNKRKRLRTEEENVELAKIKSVHNMEDKETRV